MPRVFISYSHDSPEHSGRILELAWTLRDNGCDVELDQFHQHEILDWQRWCREQIHPDNSDFVICVCTAEYQRRLNGDVSPEDGKGVFWEGNFLLTELYNNKGNSRFIPVLLGDEPASSVDNAFGVPSCCRLHEFELSDSGFEDLVRILTNQPRAKANPVGTIPDLSTKTAPPPSNQPAGSSVAPWQSSPIAVSKLPRTGDILIGRQVELRRLTQAWKNPKTCIVQIVAPGGVGKTQLVKKWRESLLDKDDHAGAVRAFDWSFYSQGTRQQASADEFFDRAMRWFGEAEPENVKDPWAKGERLAELVRQQRTLLILDGMEPLQHPPGPMAGELTDPSIKALLQGLSTFAPRKNADAHSFAERKATNGLCIVTTREAVPTLDEMSEPKRVTVDLGRLSPQAGAELLTHYGVHDRSGGILPPQSSSVSGKEWRQDATTTRELDELQQASIDVDGHALALILLGTYLQTRCDGDVRRRSEALLFRGHERYAAHAHKVLASYEAWFEQQDDTGRAAVAILRLMGLFNRPADAGCLAAMRAEPPIPGLTEALFVGDRDELWQRAIERLRAARLLADDEKGREGDKESGSSKRSPSPSLPISPSLDAHPLVREHFAGQLATDHKASSVEAHRRLYEHLKQSAPELPDNLNDMMPLYHAVAHGCKAGLEKEAFDVFDDRILRKSEHFSWRKLGAFGADLAALASFFESPWRLPSRELRDHNQALSLALAGFHLRASGRLAETAEPMRAALANKITANDWKQAAIAASNLSQLSLTLGDVSSAVRQGEQSVELADRSGDAFQRMVTRTTLAAALQAAGMGRGGDKEMGRGGDKEMGREDPSLPVSPSPDLPLSAFREAEAMQQERQPQYPLLYSLPGYRYCDLLLDEFSVFGFQFSVREPADESPEQAIARIREVRNRAETTLKIAQTALIGILNLALDHLTLGRTYVAEAELQTEPTALAAGVDGETAQPTIPEASAFGSLAQAEQHLNQSVSLLRQAGTQEFLSRGLLHRAALWRVLLARGERQGASRRLDGENARVEPAASALPLSPDELLSNAERDLSEAESIAERGSMLIFQIEAALERTRLFLALASANSASLPFKEEEVGNAEAPRTQSEYLETAREKLDEARKLICQTEKPYEPHVPDWDDWEPPEYIGVFKKGDMVGYHRHNGEIEFLDQRIKSLSRCE